MSEEEMIKQAIQASLGETPAETPQPQPQPTPQQYDEDSMLQRALEESR